MLTRTIESLKKSGDILLTQGNADEEWEQSKNSFYIDPSAPPDAYANGPFMLAAPPTHDAHTLGGG